MRQGVTTTLDLFRQYGIRATYYATGYNFLLGNTERRQFMNNPIFAWAEHTKSKKWPNDLWASTPWFANDPYGTVASDPIWYFGDLIPVLLKANQDIQSHTFSHFDGGLATQPEWISDLQAWRTVASERDVAPARSLAFPWSSSAGMSDADWDALEAAGITSVTRTKPGQPQYALASPADPHCRPGYAPAYAYAADWHMIRFAENYAAEPDADVTAAMVHASVALERGGDDPLRLFRVGGAEPQMRARRRAARLCRARVRGGHQSRRGRDVGV
jgi:hypothetical protein